MGHTLQQAIRRGANPPGLQGDDDLGCYLRIDRTRGPALSHCSSTRRAPHRLHQGVRGAPSDNLRARRLYFGTTTSHFPASRVHFPYKNDSRRSEGKRDKRDDRGRVRRGDDDRYRGSKRDQTEKRDRHRDESRHRNDDRDRSRHRKDSPCPDKERGHSSSRRDDDRRGDRRDNSRRCDRDRNRDDRRDDYKERDKQVHWEKKCAAIEREEDSELDGYFSDDWLQSQAAYYTIPNVTRRVNAARAVTIPAGETRVISAMWKEVPGNRSFFFTGSVPSALSAVVNHQAAPAVAVVNTTDKDIKFHRKQKLGNIVERDEEETYFSTTWTASLAALALSGAPALTLGVPAADGISATSALATSHFSTVNVAVDFALTPEVAAVASGSETLEATKGKSSSATIYANLMTNDDAEPSPILADVDREPRTVPYQTHVQLPEAVTKDGVHIYGADKNFSREAERLVHHIAGKKNLFLAFLVTSRPQRPTPTLTANVRTILPWTTFSRASRR
ncbi:hypothetical protein NW767_015643 [Fusarium falciforme]|nr:hypothetical protein NW767_015643 [Fusarium falciforme]